MGGSVLLLTATESSGAARNLGVASEAEWAFQIIDHVQLAMPQGGEEKAEWFYRDVLGLVVVPKPPAMAARGGRWFEQGAVKIHLGVEDDFRPAHKAHPAIVVAKFDALLARLQSAGIPFRPADDGPGARRGHIDDCFGNRIEIIDPGDG